MRGRVGSLNASVAGSIFLFEAAGQRTHPGASEPGADELAARPGEATTDPEGGRDAAPSAGHPADEFGSDQTQPDPTHAPSDASSEVPVPAAEPTAAGSTPPDPGSAVADPTSAEAETTGADPEQVDPERTQADPNPEDDALLPEAPASGALHDA
jgi:hypothetical protein